MPVDSVAELTFMASPFGVSWFCALFFSCICFLPQNGYNTAYAFDLYESTGPSPQHDSESPLNTHYANEPQARRRQNFFPFQREPFHYGNQDEENTVTNEGENVVQRQPDPRKQFSEAPPQIHEYSNGHQHPFGLLLKQHTVAVGKGVSFPTINHFKRFIESLKVSFLTPGSNTSRHFQTARETMKNFHEESMGHRQTFAQDATADNDNSPAQVRKYNMPNQQLSVPNPAGSTAGLSSSHGHDNPASSLSSASDPQHFAATGYVSSNLGNGRHPWKKDDLFKRAYENPFGQSTGSRQMRFPSGSSFGKKPSQRGHVAKRIPLDNQTPPADFNLRENFHRWTQSNDVPPQRPSFLNYHVKNSFAPNNQLYNPKNAYEQRRPPSMTRRSYQPTTGSDSKETDYISTFYQPVNDEHGPQKQPKRSNLGVRPPSSIRGPSRLNSYSRYQKVNPTRTTLTAKDRIGETSDPYVQNRASVMQTQNDKVVRPKSMTSYGTRKPKWQFSMPQRRSVVQNDGFKRAKRFGLQQTFTEPSKVKGIPLSLKRQTENPVDWPSELQFAPKDCVYWANEDKENGQRPKTSISMNALMKSRNRSGRETAHRSKLCYTPQQQAQKQSSADQWKMAVKQQTYKNEAY